ncbi:MAG TPA: hypothetical protein VHI95_13390 [Acidimicrobiales bacterium]|jgi:hypothetical protein|nr:hypothetical protein [Acidimicrobiales bacterium]
MPEPVSATVLGAISAGAAVVGAVQGLYTAANGDSGVHISQTHIQYPKEFPTTQFAHAGQSVGWDIMKFTAEGMFWDNDLAVAVAGYVSNDNNPLVGWKGSANPNIPVNRFIVLQFGESGNSENMSGGLLNVTISPWGGDSSIAEGSPDDPWVALRVVGRFDPRGHGDMQFSFKLSINSHGRLHLSETHWNGTAGDFSIDLAGDHVQVTLKQPLLAENEGQAGEGVVA